MRKRDLLFEKHYTGPLYHTTGHNQTEGILNARHFYLKDVAEDLTLAKIKETPMYNKLYNAGYQYYLSVGRAKINEFTKASRYKIVFVLNSNYFMNRPEYKLIPIDYFYGHKWVQYDNPNVKRKRESEERIWSKSDKISIDCVVEMHMCTAEDSDIEFAMEKFVEEALNSGDYAIDDYDNSYTDEEIREIEMDNIYKDFYYTDNETVIYNAEQLNIPLYFYETDYDNYRILNKRKAERFA